MSSGHAPSPRPTLRCLTDDLGLSLPPLEQQLSGVNHELMDEARRLAPAAPQGQKRILAIDYPVVYRVRHGRWRGATWLDKVRAIFWLCAGAMREEGSGSEAYQHFKALNDAGRLLPDARDAKRLAAEEVAQILDQVADLAPHLVDDARTNQGEDVGFLMSCGISGRVHATRPDELWVAVSHVSQRAEAAGCSTGDDWIEERILLLILARFKLAAGATEEEGRLEWPSGPLEYYEVARFYV